MINIFFYILIPQLLYIHAIFSWNRVKFFIVAHCHSLFNAQLIIVL